MTPLQVTKANLDTSPAKVITKKPGSSFPKMSTLRWEPSRAEWILEARGGRLWSRKWLYVFLLLPLKGWRREGIHHIWPPQECWYESYDTSWGQEVTHICRQLLVEMHDEQVQNWINPHLKDFKPEDGRTALSLLPNLWSWVNPATRSIYPGSWPPVRIFSIFNEQVCFCVNKIKTLQTLIMASSKEETFFFSFGLKYYKPNMEPCIKDIWGI